MPLVSVGHIQLNCVCLLRTEQNIRGGTRHSVTRLYLVIPNYEYALHISHEHDAQELLARLLAARV